MEQYLGLTRGNHAPSINDDAHEHVERILDIVNLFNIPGVTHDALMLCVFSITLTGAAKRWVDRLPLRTVDSWDLLKRLTSKGTVLRPRLLSSLKRSITSSRKAMKHYTKLGKGIMTCFINDPLTTSIAIRRNIDSSSSSEGIAAIVSKLDSLGRDMKQLKEKVHAIQVGYQTCGGAHLDKECPLNEEVKKLRGS
ncbi:hypothetical protein Tco_0196102 [Tanacetum coccineum]